MKLRFAFAFAAAQLMLAALPAAAQPYYSSRADGGYRFELTPTVSYRFGGNLSGQDSPLFDTDLQVEDSSAIGVTLDLPLSSDLQLELLANRQSSELVFDEGLFGGSAGVADIDVSYYHVGLLWQGRHPRVAPFFVASAGVATLDPDIPGSSSETRFSASLGGGVKVFFSDSIGLRFEGRGFFSDYDAGGGRSGRCDRYDRYYDSCYDESFSQGQASVGLIVAW